MVNICYYWVQSLNGEELIKKEQQYILKYNSKQDGFNKSRGGDFKKKIYKYSLDDGRLINTFNCLEDAAENIGTNKKAISKACFSVNKTYMGFYWSYNNSEPFKPNKDVRKKQVSQFSFSGNLITNYSSVSEASIITGVNKSSIAKVCRGERTMAGGYYWQYIVKSFKDKRTSYEIWRSHNNCRKSKNNVIETEIIKDANTSKLTKLSSQEMLQEYICVGCSKKIDAGNEIIHRYVGNEFSCNDCYVDMMIRKFG